MKSENFWCIKLWKNMGENFGLINLHELDKKIISLSTNKMKKIITFRIPY